MNSTLKLFPEIEAESSKGSSPIVPGGFQPLADKMRPEAWQDFEGLESLDQKLFSQLREGRGRPPSVLFWGPPGSGKTTLARLIGGSYHGHFIEHSGVLVGVKEIREIALSAERKSIPTLLFIDEIHRLNKGQQDAFLPHIEKGTFSLIGATTENPSFYLNNALLSRMRLVLTGPLSEDALEKILQKASSKLGLFFDNEAIKRLCQVCEGDARRLLNLLESLSTSVKDELAGQTISKGKVEDFLANSGYSHYDRSGELHYNIVSAFIKSMRGSDPDAALYYCFRMIEGGEDPRFVIRRMMIFASEDIGNADPQALGLAVATAEAFDRLGLPEGKIPIAHCVTYLASAPKSNRSYVAMNKAIESVKQFPLAAVPMHLRNAPTGLMKQLGFGKGYVYPHDQTDATSPGLPYAPIELVGVRFYEPSENGAEAVIKQRLMAQVSREIK